MQSSRVQLREILQLISYHVPEIAAITYCIFHTLIWDKLLVFLGPNHYLNYPSFSFIFQLSSQHPYLETFVGKPLVYTVNIWNRTEVTRTLKKALKKQVKITLIFYHCYMGTAPYGGKGQNPFNAVTL